LPAKQLAIHFNIQQHNCRAREGILSILIATLKSTQSDLLRQQAQLSSCCLYARAGDDQLSNYISLGVCAREHITLYISEVSVALCAVLYVQHAKFVGSTPESIP
jgi:hypothetical protein